MYMVFYCQTPGDSTAHALRIVLLVFAYEYTW